MGVVRNLMVRVGANVSGVVKGMKTAGASTREAKENIQKNTTNIKETVKNGFDGAGRSVRAYMETVSNTRQAHQVAKQNVARLSDEVGQMKGVYATVKAATEGMDLSKPLAKQLQDAEKEMAKIEAKRADLQRKLGSATAEGKGDSPKGLKLRADLEAMNQKAKEARETYSRLSKVAKKVGQENIGYASNAGMEKLRQQIEQTEGRMRTAQTVVDETGRRLRELRLGPTIARNLQAMGRTAAQAAANGIAKLGTGLKNVGAGALRGIPSALKRVGTGAMHAASGGIRMLKNGIVGLARAGGRGLSGIAGKLAGIGRSAGGSLGNLTKMVGQIRNMGALSTGLRLVGGLFRGLGNVIKGCISGNDELNAAVSLMQYQLEKALAPAIRTVITLVQQLMPIVQSVCAGIHAVLRAILGDIGDVQYAYLQLGTYSFDQITKEDNATEDDGTEQEQSALVQKLTAWIQQLKEAFAAGNWENLGILIGEGINNAFNAITSIDLGAKVGAFVNNLATTLNAALKTIDFGGMGAALAGGINDLFGAVDWALVGETVANALLALPTIAVAAITEADWNLIGTAVSDFLRSALDTATAWIHATDWLKVGNAISTFVESTDWGGIASSFFDLVAAAFGAIDFTAIGATVAAMINDAVHGADWAQVGNTIGAILVALPQALVGFILATDWASVGDAASTALRSTLATMTDWIRSTDWVKLGQSLNNLIAGIDWGGVARNLSECLTEALDAVSQLVQSIDWVMIGRNIKHFIDETDWAGIANSFYNLFSAAFGTLDFASIGAYLAEKLNAVTAGIEWGEMGRMVGEGLSMVLGLIVSAIAGFDWVGTAEKLATELNGLVYGFDWAGLGEGLTNLCLTLLQTVKTLIVTFDWAALGAGIADGINSIDFAQILTDLGQTVSDLLVAALDLVLEFGRRLDWAKLGDDIWVGLCGIVTGIEWNEIISKAFELVGVALGGATQLVATFFGRLWDALVAGWNSCKDYWNQKVEEAGGDTWQGFLNGVKEGLTNIGNWIVTNIWDPFKKGFCEAFGIHSPSTKAAEWGDNVIQGLKNGIITSFGGIVTWINMNLWWPFRDGFEAAFSGLKTKMEEIFNGVKNAVKTPINGILSFINSMINGVCNGVNTMIDALNAINVEVPDWGIFGDLAGKSFGFSLERIFPPTIPLLAEGGIVDGATPLIAGEKGKEAIVPLENNTEWIDKVADKVSTKVSGGGGSGQPVIVQLYIGKRKLTEYVIQDINQITKSTGVCPIKV